MIIQGHIYNVDTPEEISEINKLEPKDIIPWINKRCHVRLRDVFAEIWSFIIQNSFLDIRSWVFCFFLFPELRYLCSIYWINSRRIREDHFSNTYNSIRTWWFLQEMWQRVQKWFERISTRNGGQECGRTNRIYATFAHIW